MLFKLIKLDLRFACRKFLSMAVLLIIMGLATPLLSDTAAYAPLSLVFVLVSCVVAVVSIVLILQHYGKNLFGSEGYFMFTLPVKPWQILLSKVITAFIWLNLMFLSAFMMIAFAMGDAIKWNEVWGLLSNIDSLKYMINFMLTVYSISMPIILSVYLGISVSNITFKRKALGGGVSLILSLLAVFIYAFSYSRIAHFIGELYLQRGVNVATGLVSAVPGSVASTVCYLTGIAFSLLYFFLTLLILSKKLNLK